MLIFLASILSARALRRTRGKTSRLPCPQNTAIPRVVFPTLLMAPNVDGALVKRASMASMAPTVARPCEWQGNRFLISLEDRRRRPAMRVEHRCACLDYKSANDGRHIVGICWFGFSSASSYTRSVSSLPCMFLLAATSKVSLQNTPSLPPLPDTT